MKKFYSAMEDRWMKYGGNDARSWWSKMGTPDFLSELRGDIQEARAQTEEGSLYRKRVELIDAGIMQYLLKARARYEKSAMSEFAPVATGAIARASVPTHDEWAADATWKDALTNTVEKTTTNDAAPQKTLFKLAWDDK